MNKLYAFVGLCVLVLVGGLGWMSYKGSASTDRNTPLKVGFIAPLTGDAANVGESVQDGAKLAVSEINAAGGIGGRQIGMIYEDGKCTGKDAASAAQKLVHIDGVKYMLGGLCSGEAFGSEPVIAEAKVVSLLPGASAPKLAGMTPYMMRSYPNDNITGVAIADYLAAHYKKAAIVTEKADYPQGLKSVFIPQAQKDALTVVSVQDYDSNTTDFRTMLTAVKAEDPDVIFINAQDPASFIRVGTQARALGIKAQFVAASFNDQTIIDAGASMDGMITSVMPGIAPEGKGAEFTKRFVAVYGKDALYPYYAGAAYDDVYLLKQAIESVGNDSTKVEEYLHTMPSYTGAIGTYHFDQNGDVVGINPIFQKLSGGKFVTM